MNKRGRQSAGPSCTGDMSAWKKLYWGLQSSRGLSPVSPYPAAALVMPRNIPAKMNWWSG